MEELGPHLPSMSAVQMVLVGHGHYDHVLDLPEVCDSLAPDAVIYGGRTLKHIFAKSNLSRPIVPVNDMVSTHQKSGEWIYTKDRRMRMMPILSGHPNQWLCFHLFKKKLKKDLSKKPSRAWDYQEGISLAFLIDFLEPETEKIAKRVYLQSSSTGHPAGFFPPEIVKDKKVDVALLPMDCANIRVEGRLPSILDLIQPKNVIFCHWEDFFEPKSGVPKEIVKVDLHKLKKFFKSTKETQYIFPYWNSTFKFR